MSKVRFLAFARTNLVDILGHVTEISGSLTTAQGFVARLRRQCHRLATLPGRLGRARPELPSDLRSFPCESYVIFFRYEAGTVEIVGCCMPAGIPVLTSAIIRPANNR
ncbi:type II toxin-antitoxin system RelE/ParE family toxin [Methylobacterium sp. CM6244]